MLQGDFYNIVGCESSGEEPGAASWRLKFNAEHDIYRGHFPGKPITPGMCIMAVARELCSQMAGCRLRVRSVKNIKFLNIIDPTVCGEVMFDCELMPDDDGFRARATVHDDTEKVYAKLSLVLTRSEL